ncbi:MAG: hypothetical protein ACLQPD_00245 [Desulfomonilaceae bacterium]
MIKLLAACLTFISFVLIGSSVSASNFTAADLKIDAIKQTLEVQLERIRNAREKADTQMSLAKMRIAERLRLSSEELTRQLEILERLREHLSTGSGESQQAIDQSKSDWAGLLGTAFAEINSQVGQTNSLISQMEALRDSFEDSSASTPTLSYSQTPQAPQLFSPSEPPTTIDSLPTTTTPTLTTPTAPSTGST